MNRLGLSISDKEALDNFVREKVGRVAIRALIILWYDDGMPQSQIANLLGISSRTARRWIKRYKHEGISGLLDRPKTGRPRKVTDQVKKEIQEAMEKSPSDLGYTY